MGKPLLKGGERHDAKDCTYCGPSRGEVDFDKKVAVVSYDAKKTMAQQLEHTIEETGVFRAELVSRALPKGNE